MVTFSNRFDLETNGLLDDSTTISNSYQFCKASGSSANFSQLQPSTTSPNGHVMTFLDFSPQTTAFRGSN
jgi:hypothetical protein